MNVCACCLNEGDDDKCVGCKHDRETEDRFDPDNKCRSCLYDPRLHGVCATCLDGDKMVPKRGGGLT